MAEDAKPLEFSDFSGGITENYLQADPRRYERADNLLITVDKKLEERPGIIPFSTGGYFLGGTTTKRINAFFSFINETILMPVTGRDIYYYTKTTDVWSRIVGVAGNSPLQGGDTDSQVSYAEFQRQVYLTSDGDLSGRGINPSKIFRNESNVWTAKTAGLPRAYAQGTYTDATLLANCINLANAIRTAMIAHINDAKNTAYIAPAAYTPPPSGFLHINIDKYSLSYLVTQSFIGSDPEVPSPIPTAQGPATNLATLLTLVNALNLCYTHHITDAMHNSQGVQDTITPFYHGDILTNASWFISQFTFKGPGAPLANNTTPSTLEKAAAMLDDLYQKWNWHRKAVNTHAYLNNPTDFDKHQIAGTKIGTITKGNVAPPVTPDYSDLYNYVANLRFIYNSHVTQTPFGNHKRRDNASDNYQLEMTLPAPLTLDDSYLTIYWLRGLYSKHTYDAQAVRYRNITFSATAGSVNITSVVDATSGASQILEIGSVIEWNNVGNGFASIVNQYDGSGFYSTAKVVSAGVGTATLDRAALTTTSYSAQVTRSLYHSSHDSTGLLQIDSSANREVSAAALGNQPYALGTDTKSWLVLANEFFYALKAHSQNPLVHWFNSSVTQWAIYLNRTPYPFIIPSVAFYGYAYFFSDEYTVEQNGIKYLVQGNPVFSDSVQAAVSLPVGYIPADQNLATFSTLVTNTTVRTTYGNLLSNLPSISNSLNTNYDTGNIKLNIYRTTDGGNTYYLLAQLPNGTTNYLDLINDTVANAGDTALNTGRQVIYTSGGIKGYDQPPLSKFIHLLNGYTYYGAITDTGQYFPNRILQSVAFAPDATPLANTLDLDDELTGLSSTKSNLIALCKASIIRVTGGFNAQGQGSLIAEKISETMGNLNAKGVVRTELGVFFAGTDGFYYTDGFQIIKISIDLDKTYAALTASANQRRSIYGAYDKLTRRIHWSMKTSETDTDNSITYTFYLDYGIKPSGVFTDARNGLNYRPSSMVFQEGVAYYGHEKGAILKSYVYAKYDIKVAMGTAIGLWERIYIPYNFKSAAVDMGTIYKRKYITKQHTVGKNIGNISAIPYVLKDLNETQAGRKPMSPINYAVNPVWGTPIIIWGVTPLKWEYDGKMDLIRRFPATTLRSDFVQVQYTPNHAAAVYVSSVGYPLGAFANVNSTLKTAQILTPAGYTALIWPIDVVNYSISFSTDNYATSYPILSFSGNSLTYSDAANTSITNPTAEWQITGTKKEQRFSLTSFVLHYSYLGDEVQSYPGSKSTSGAGNGGFNP